LITAAAYREDGRRKEAELAARDQALVALGLYTGLRVSELVDLALGDLDLRERGKEALTVRCGKGGKIRRSGIVKEALKRLETYLKVRRSPAIGEPVFVSTQGARLDPKTVQRLAKCIGARTGYAWLTPHKWRHSLATHLYEVSGGDLLLVMRQLGHENPETTAIYAKCTDPALRRAMEKL